MGDAAGWDHLDDFLKVYEAAKAKKWLWSWNSRCKYVEKGIAFNFCPFCGKNISKPTYTRKS